MTTCIHGIPFDRWCGECEWDFLNQPEPDPVRRRWAAVTCAAVLLAGVLLFAVTRSVR